MDGSYDEVFAAPGQPREHAVALAAALADLGPDALTDAGRHARLDLHAAGDHVRRRAGPDVPTARCATGRSRSTSSRGSSPPASGATSSAAWRSGSARSNAFVDDVYHAREIVHAGIVPWELIVSRPAFARAAHGIRPPGGVYCHVSGCDLVRDADGSWKVLEDNVRTPSGISYVLENRVAMTRLLPGLFGSYRVRPVDHYPALLRTALHRGRPDRAPRRRRPSSSGPRARSTPPTSSTPSSRARWASSWSRPPTSWCATPRATSAPRTGSSASTRSTAGSTTTSWTRSSSAPTRCSASRG